MISLGRGQVRVVVDEDAGGRVASLVVRGAERFVTRGPDSGPLAWGSYPMVPWAGRVRRGRFVFEGRSVALPLGMPPHAIHGTVFDRRWDVRERSAESTTLQTDLGPDWPWAGQVTHTVTVTDDGVRCRLEVRTNGDAFPAQVGWHPWFTDGGRPPALEFAAQGMYLRDADGIPDGTCVSPAPHPWDDCFVGVTDAPRLRWRDGVVLELMSDCDHWVVYEPDHAVCVEPQSGPPDAFTIAPVVVTLDRPLSRSFTVTLADS